MTRWLFACLALPVALSSNGLPPGVKIVGPIDGDDRAFEMTNWIREHSARRSHNILSAAQGQN